MVIPIYIFYNYTFVYHNLLATKSDEICGYQSEGIEEGDNTDKIGNKDKFVGSKYPIQDDQKV